jgi:hypothetical protein
MPEKRSFSAARGEVPPVRRFLLLLALTWLGVAGCTRYAGPLAVRQMGRADAPGYSIAEQEVRGRERLTITEDDWRIGPKAYIDRVSPTGR